MSLRSTILEMRAADAGLDRRLPPVGEWLAFGAAGNRATLWLRQDEGSFVVAAGPSDVVAEVGEVLGCDPWIGPVPEGAAAGWRCDSELALDALCRRVAMLGHTLPDAPLRQFQAAVETELPIDPAERTTERIREVRERVGQDIFRASLMKYWDGKCAITGVSIPFLLRASHAKPWADSTDAERLDVHNGLLLVVHLDLLFDRGLIAIDPAGRVLVSRRLGTLERRVFGVDSEASVKRLRPEHQGYLAWHRAREFDPGT